MKRTSSFIAFVILTFAAASFAQTTSKDETALRNVVTKMTISQTAFDSKALDSIFTADFIEISPIGEFDSREKVLSFYTPAEKAKANGMVVSIEPNFRSVRIYGDTAVVIAELAYVISQGGKSMPARKMMMTAVGRKEMGEWKLASVQYTGIRPPQTPAPKPQ